MVAKKPTRKEHYVPEFYLQNFVNHDGQVWVYNRKTGKRFCQIPKNICYQHDLYETKAVEMNPAIGEYILQNQIENQLCESEGIWSALIKKILDVCRLNIHRDALICTTAEKQMLADFVSNLMLRNPWTLENACLDDISSAKALDDTRVVQELLNALDLGKIDSILKYINLSNHFNTEFGSQKLLTDELLGLKMSFVYNKNADFVTSCHPVIYGIRDKGDHLTDVFLPLSPEIMLLYGFEDSKRVRSNRLNFNNKFSALLKYLYMEMYSPDRAQFIISREEEALSDIENLKEIKF